MKLQKYLELNSTDLNETVYFIQKCKNKPGKFI